MQNKPGIYAWFIFFLSACFLFYKYILQISPSVMTHELMQTYALTGTSLGFLVGFYFYAYLIMQIPSGILLDRYGARVMTSFAVLCCALGVLLFSTTHSFTLACFGRLLIGFGAAFATTSYMKLAGLYFEARYFPLLSGLFGFACMAGAGTAEAPIAWLTHHIGWRATLMNCAIAGIILFFLFIFFLSEKRGNHMQEADTSLTFHWRDFFSLFKSASNWGLLFYEGFAFIPTAVFGGLWGVPFLMTAYHLQKSAAAFAVSLIFFGFAIGGFFTGILGKRLKRQKPLLIMGPGSACILLAIVLYANTLPFWLLSTLIFLVGFCSSGFLLSYAIAKSSNSVALTATLIGVINMGDPICGAIAEPLIGKILDLNWQGTVADHIRVFSVHAYHLGLSVLIIYFILALVCCIFIREKTL